MTNDPTNDPTTNFSFVIVMKRLVFGISLVLAFGNLSVMGADPPDIVHVPSEPIFRITAKDGKDMLKSVPGLLKDLASSPVGKGVSRTAAWVDAAILAEDIGLELFDAQLDRQRTRLLVLDGRAAQWKARVDNEPPLSSEEKILMREEFRLMMKELETSNTRFASRAFTQQGTLKIVGAGVFKHYGLKALASWATKLFRPGTRVKEVIFSGTLLSQPRKRILQAAWKALEKRQLEANKVIDAVFKDAAKAFLKEAAGRGQEIMDQAKREESERETRNAALSSLTMARWNVAMRIEAPAVAIAAFQPAPVPVAAVQAPVPVAAAPVRVYVPADPVLRAVSVDYQVSRAPSAYSSADDDRPSTTPEYREERFYPREERRSVSEGESMRQLRSVNIRGWGSN